LQCQWLKTRLLDHFPFLVVSSTKHLHKAGVALDPRMAPRAQDAAGVLAQPDVQLEQERQQQPELDLD
jgi:hypothetical protein